MHFDYNRRRPIAFRPLSGALFFSLPGTATLGGSPGIGCDGSTATRSAKLASVPNAMARHFLDPRTHEVLDIKSAWLVFAAALAIRALELWELADTPLLEFVLGDAKNYVAWGRELAAGNWMGDETFYQAPLYPYFLGVLFSVFGDDLFAVRVFQLFMGSGSCAFLALAGARFFSPRAGLAAGLAMAVYGPAVYADAMIQKSVLDIFFVCLSLWLVSVMATRPSIRACLGLGMALGTMTLTRENALVFPVVLVPWLALALDADRRRRAAFAALFVVGMALVLGPVAVRNWVVGGEFHLTTSQFGHNFYIGNNPAADGTYAPLIEGRGDPRVERLDAIDLAEHALGKRLSPSEVSGFYTERALQFILGEPVDWLRLMLRKVLLVFTATEMVDTEDQYTHAENSLVLTATGSLFHFGVLTPVALLGVILTWSRRRQLLPLYLMFTLYTATLVIFYVFARYRLPLVPFLVLFAGAGVAYGRDYFVASTNPGRGRVAAVLIATAVFCNWPIADKDYMRSVTHYNLGNELAGVGRIDQAIDEFRLAMALYAKNAFAAHNLGALLARKGDLAGAEAHYRIALKINPKYAQARFNLGRTLVETGKFALGVEQFDRGLEVEAMHPEIQTELGELFERRGDWAGAIARYEAALRLEPSSARARENLVRARSAGVGS